MGEESATFAEDVPAATIAVERARAEIILVAGGADLLWPSDTAAHAIAARLQAHGKTARLIEHPGAGHSPVFPGEPARRDRLSGPGAAARGQRRTGRAAWAGIVSRLNLTD